MYLNPKRTFLLGDPYYDFLVYILEGGRVFEVQVKGTHGSRSGFSKAEGLTFDELPGSFGAWGLLLIIKEWCLKDHRT